MRPIIGVTCGTSDIDKDDNLIWNNYLLAVESAGGTPIILPLIRNKSSLDDFTNMIDGLLLSGGADLDPRFYEEEPRSEIGRIDKGRDQVEMYLAKEALKANIPIFGVCRGIQVLNVAAGGTLYQDIPSELRNILNHRQAQPWPEGTQIIDIKPGSRLREIVGQPELNVNSFHHQAIKKLAPDFIVSAVTRDGIIEGIECLKHFFAIGVQFHPERMYQDNPPINALFTAFVNAAREYKRRERGESAENTEDS